MTTTKERKLNIELDGVGHDVLAIRPFSAHPSDQYLAIVLARREKHLGREYVTWVYNWECPGASGGHYFEDFAKALEDFGKRRL